MTADPRAKIRKLEDLSIWQRGMSPVESVYALTRSFPKDEMYVLTAQLRRAAISIPSNIAEGFARLHDKEYRSFLYTALGSAAELKTQIMIARRLECLGEPQAPPLSQEIDEISKMIMALIKKLRINT